MKRVLQAPGAPVVAKINGKVLWDMRRPLAALWENADSEEDSGEPISVEFLSPWDSEQAQMVAWHSASHVLGGAISRVMNKSDNALLRALLADGPPTLRGFFYEFDLVDLNGDGAQNKNEFVTSCLPDIRREVKRTAKADLPFERFDLTVEEAREAFADNPYKLEIVERIAERTALDNNSKSTDFPISVYVCGAFADLCTGPHALSTAVASAFEVENVSTAQYDTRNLPVAHMTVRRPPSSCERSDSGNKEPAGKSSLATVEVPVAREEIHRLYRIHAVAFPTSQELTTYRERQQELERRSHTNIAKQQELFMLDSHHAPGAAFWLPHGVRVLHRLEEFLRKEYALRGFDEVRTPQMFTPDLWKRSGHWDHYRDDMFHVTGSHHSHSSGAGNNNASQSNNNSNNNGAVVDPANSSASEEHQHEFMLKPMNCPAHCLIFQAQPRSYAQLPIRLADFGALHRNELSGALHGLTRCIRFHQDDAHIFCTPAQIHDELASCLDFVRHVYTKCLGFAPETVKATLSTRPQPSSSTIGSDQQWEGAERQLQEALDASGLSYSIATGEGAFYGPKVDIQLADALGRAHQCGTVQLDFNLPASDRFDLKYIDAEGVPQTPVMIHRAVLGSLERMFAILAEHHGGRWPLWLSPRQVSVLPIADRHVPHAEAVAKRLTDAGFFAAVDSSSNTTQKKILRAQTLQTNFMLVIGDREMAADSAGNVRTREGEQLGVLSVDSVLELLHAKTVAFV